MNRSQNLTGKRIAFLATDGFEESELVQPLNALKEMGADIHVVAPAKTMLPGVIRGWDHTKWGSDVPVDKSLDEARSDDYDALVLPGGVMNPDKLRTDTKALDFLREFFEAGKPVGAICHGPQTMIDAGVVSGRTMTSYPAIRRDLENAGARWEDRAVVVDQGLVTSRKPADLPAFIDKVAEEVLEGIHSGQHA
ncbi:MAG TPA: type 1 glutamine amidotransferase domain-containing protein [Phycisphaerales bacterium]|nr:type 1 glutamine amidotransferase domain-containing protein [Phycisphaerales bacterium]